MKTVAAPGSCTRVRGADHFSLHITHQAKNIISIIL